ncbi:stalk domain-containing protein [Desulforudis sp. DRI-14]
MSAAFLPMQAAAGGGIGIVIDGKTVTVPLDDQAPLILDGRTYVPLRIIGEGLGAKVEWRSATRQVIITTFSSGSEAVPSRPPGRQNDVQIVIDGRVLAIPPDYGQPLVTRLGRTVVPLRTVGEALGCEVNWRKESRTVDVKSRLTFPVPSRDAEPSAPSSTLFQELAAYRTNLKLLDGSVSSSAELLHKSEADFSTQQIEQFKTYLSQLSKYPSTVKLPDGTVIAMADLTIQGPAVAAAGQLKAWLAAETPRIRAKMAQQYGREFVPIPDLAELYLCIGAEYGIRGDLAFCQAAKETHYWQFTGSVQPFQNNYCGLWATGSPCTGQEPLNGADPQLVRFEPGIHGAIFASPEAGVEAHIQHLYAYACRNPLPPGKVLVDPRYNLVARGSAPTWQKLNARWAVPGTTYGQSIIYDYWLKALTF